MKINKDNLIEKVAIKITDSADLDSLMSYFLEGQINFLESLSDDELVQYAKEFMSLDENEVIELS